MLKARPALLPNARRRLAFAIGPRAMTSLGNGYAHDRQIEKENKRSLFNGLVLGKLQSKDKRSGA